MSEETRDAIVRECERLREVTDTHDRPGIFPLTTLAGEAIRGDAWAAVLTERVNARLAKIGEWTDAPEPSDVRALAADLVRLRAIRDEGLDVVGLLKVELLKKNTAYGDSATDPIRVFSSASPIEQLLVRIDDKLSRIYRGYDVPGEDTILDLTGYLVLLVIVLGEPEPVRGATDDAMAEAIDEVRARACAAREPCPEEHCCGRMTQGADPNGYYFVRCDVCGATE